MDAKDLDPRREHSSKRLGDEETSAEWASVEHEVLVERKQDCRRMWKQVRGEMLLSGMSASSVDARGEHLGHVRLGVLHPCPDT